MTGGSLIVCRLSCQLNGPLPLRSARKQLLEHVTTTVVLWQQIAATKKRQLYAAGRLGMSASCCSIEASYTLCALTDCSRVGSLLVPRPLHS
jgi:NADH:ubiquinone oxidoreductase subunit B-like Fe-S oxidoreductase